MSDEQKKGRIVEPLALRYRPNTLDGLVGQDALVKRVRGMLKDMSLPSAILLAGPSGCGKTTAARILARTINCKELTGCGECPSCRAFDRGNHPDYSETNAATERGIDDIRAMVQKAKMMPTLGNMRIFVIDEAQQLTPQASQALLKPIEEPASRTLWIIGSMEPDRLHAAIVNRCQTFTLSLLDHDLLTAHIAWVSQQEGFGKKIPQEIYELIADLSGGHVRAAMQGLETVIQYVKGFDKKPENLLELIKKNVVQAHLIDSDDQQAVRVLTALMAGNQKALHVALLDVQNHIGLATKLMFQIQYCLSQLFGITKHQTVWHTPINKSAWESVQDVVADRSEKLSWPKSYTSMYMRNNLLTALEVAVACRTQLQSFIVPEVLTSITHYERACLSAKVAGDAVNSSDKCNSKG